MSVTFVKPVSQYFDLCGHGTSYEDCQEPKHKGCNMHDGEVFVKKYYKNCMRLQCPKCLFKVASVKGYKAAKRIKAYKLKYANVKHIIISPHPDLEFIEDYNSIRKKAMKTLKLLHTGTKESLGGVLIAHPYRCNEFKKYEKVGLHFHYIGYGNINYNKVDEYYKNGKIFFIKDKGKRKTIQGTIYYALTHCGVPKENGSKKYQSITWMGRLSYNKKLKCYDCNRKQTNCICDLELCPVCRETQGERAKLFELECVGNESHNPPDEDGGFYPSSDWIYPTEKHPYDCLCCGLPV